LKGWAFLIDFTAALLDFCFNSEALLVGAGGDSGAMITFLFIFFVAFLV